MSQNKNISIIKQLDAINKRDGSYIMESNYISRQPTMMIIRES